MNSFMSWVGGKKALRDEIVIRLNRKCDRYVEVFGGGGWVLFHKPPGKFEVYNDFNPNLANLYRCVREHPKELCEELRYTLNSRLDFEYIRTVLHSNTEIPDIRRAAWFYQIIRESYASGLDSFGAQPHSMWRNFPLIDAASARLQNVVIENKDFAKLIKALGINEDTLFCTSYEDGTLCVEAVNEEDPELIGDIPAEATDTYRLGYGDGYRDGYHAAMDETEPPTVVCTDEDDCDDEDSPCYDCPYYCPECGSCTRTEDDCDE